MKGKCSRSRYYDGEGRHRNAVDDLESTGGVGAVDYRQARVGLARALAIKGDQRVLGRAAEVARVELAENHGLGKGYGEIKLCLLDEAGDRVPDGGIIHIRVGQVRRRAADRTGNGAVESCKAIGTYTRTEAVGDHVRPAVLAGDLCLALLECLVGVWSADDEEFDGDDDGRRNQDYDHDQHDDEAPQRKTAAPAPSRSPPNRRGRCHIIARRVRQAIGNRDGQWP